jgi:hypothetical protein
MYSTSTAFKTAISSPQRDLRAYVTVNGVTYSSTNDNLIGIKYNHGVIGNKFEIGQTPSAYLEVQLKDVSTSFDNATVQAFIGVDIDGAGTYEYVPMGIFVVEETAKTLTTTTLKCHDRMVKLEAAFTSTSTSASAILTHIMTGLSHGITLPSHLTSLTLPVLKNRTKRQVLGYIATIMGGFAYVDRSGAFQIKVSPTSPSTTPKQVIDGDQYFNLTREDIDQTIQAVAVSDGKTSFSSGTVTTGVKLAATSPYITSGTAANVLSYVNGLPIRSYSIKWIGNPAIELGDNIKIIEWIDESTSNTFYVNVGEMDLTFQGGLEGTLGNIGDGKTKIDFYTVGELASIVESLGSEIDDAKTAAINAQLAAETAESSAFTAQTAANGKNKVFYNVSTNVPIASAIGDMWFVADKDNLLRQWDGTSWVDKKTGTLAISEIDAAVVTVKNLSASKITSGVFKTTSFDASGNEQPSSKIEMYRGNFDLIDSSGVKKASIGMLYDGSNYYPMFQFGSNGYIYKDSSDMVMQLTTSSNGTPQVKLKNDGSIFIGGYSYSTVELFGVIKTSTIESGKCGCGSRFQPTATGQPIASEYVQFRTQKTYTPSSISLSADATNASATADNITSYGFYLTVNSTNTNLGLHYWRGSYSA